MLIVVGPTGVGKSWIACSRGSGFGGGDLRVPIEGAIVTIDAIGRQKAIAKKIIDKGADYLLSRLCPNASHAIPYGVVRRCVRIPDHPPGLPVLRALSLCACCRHYPGAAAGRRLRSSHPAVTAFPDNVVGSACTSSFSRSHEAMVATCDSGA